MVTDYMIHQIAKDRYNQAVKRNEHIATKDNYGYIENNPFILYSDIEKEVREYFKNLEEKPKEMDPVTKDAERLLEIGSTINTLTDEAISIRNKYQKNFIQTIFGTSKI